MPRAKRIRSTALAAASRLGASARMRTALAAGHARTVTGSSPTWTSA